MKKFAMLALAMSLFLVACGEKTAEKATEAVQTAAAEVKDAATEAKDAVVDAVSETKMYTAKTEDGKEFALAITGDVATLTAADGTVTELKRAESADGERFADDKGNEIHMKGEEGILTLGDLKDVAVTVTEAAAK